MEEVPVVVKFQPPGDNVQFIKGSVEFDPDTVRTSHKISGADWLWARTEKSIMKIRERNICPKRELGRLKVSSNQDPI